MARWTRLYLRLLSFAYVSAFLSAYVQLPGLLGYDGLEPAGVVLSRVAPQYERRASDWSAIAPLYAQLPTLAWAHVASGLSVDSILELCCLVGGVVSLAGVCGVLTGVGFAISYVQNPVLVFAASLCTRRSVVV